MEESRNISLSLEGLCKLIEAGRAMVVRYGISEDKSKIIPTLVEHPDNIVDDDVLILDHNKKIMERKTYKIKRVEELRFDLRETLTFFDKKDVSDLVSCMFTNRYGFSR